MTDLLKPDKEDSKAAPTLPPVPARAPKSGRGLAGLALLIALGAAGGGGYLWYRWQQEQASQAGRLDAAIKQALAKRDPEFQAIKTQLQDLQPLKSALEQTRSDSRTANQEIKSQFLGLTGDFQPLKNAMELQKGETDLLKGEMKLLRDSYATNQTERDKQKEELDGQLQKQQGDLAKLNEQFKNLQLTNNGLTEELDALKLVVAKGGDVNAFPLAEVDYLLRLANSKLKLERNLPTARLALETAQQRLKAVEESALAPVQTLLGETIGSLRGVKLPDFSSLAHKLVEMEAQVNVLPLKINSSAPDIKSRIKPADNATISDDLSQPWWSRTGEAVWNQFKGIVVFRRARSDAPPLIGMEEEFFLRHNLRLTLESMRLALLRGDAQSYQDSLEKLKTWLNTYFDIHDSRVIAFLSELQVLQTVEFNTYIPDLAGLNQAFQEALARRQPIRPVSRASGPTTSEQPFGH